MDCRNSLFVAISLCLVASGCLTTAGTTTTQLNVKPPPDAVIQSAKSGPPQKPHVETIISWAQAKAGEADKDTNETLQLEDYDMARKLYQDAIKSDPKHLPAYQGLAQVYIKVREPERAIDTLLKATTISPSTAPLWQELAMAYNCRKDWHKAAECMYKALEIEPENHTYQKILGCTLARAGQFDESLAVLTRAYRSAPQAHLMLSDIFKGLHQYDRCRDQLEAAKQANPTEPEARDIEARWSWLEHQNDVPAAMNAPVPDMRQASN